MPIKSADYLKVGAKLLNYLLASKNLARFLKRTSGRG